MLRLGELGDLFSAAIQGDLEIEVERALPLERAGPACVTLVENLGDAVRFGESGIAAAWVAARYVSECGGRAVLVSGDPGRGFAACRRYLSALGRGGQVGVHGSAVVHESAVLGRDVTVGPFVEIQAGAEIGDRAILEAGCVIEAGASIGRGTIVHSNAVVGAGARVGRLCEIGSGAVVGAESTAYTVGFEGWERRSGEAGVWLGDEVEIGPQTVVERGLEQDTRIGDGAILGGQVYAGHDCQVGRHCLIMAQCALGGRATVGDQTTLMARVAVNPGIRIGQQVLVLGGSAVYGSIADRSKVFGVPARPHREGLRALATPSMVKSLRRRVEELEVAGRPAKSQK